MSTRLRATCLVLLLLVAATAGAGVAPTVTGQEAEAPTRINSCTTITEPGRYVLVADIANITDTCIRIRADDVVLDGQGHTLYGVQSEANRQAFTNASLAPEAAMAAGNFSNESFDALLEDYPTPRNPRWDNVGVEVNAPRSLSNVSVRNLTVTQFAFGVYYDGVTGGSVSDLTATENGDGLEMYNTSDLSVVDSRLVDNEWGAFVWNGSNVTVRNVTADDGFVGLNVADVTDLTVANSSTMDNDAAGLVLDYVTRSTVTNLNGSENGYIGVFLGSSTRVTIRDSTFSNTEGEDPRASPFPDSAALALDNASHNTFVNVTAVESPWSFYAYNGSRANVAESLRLNNVTVSFTATNVALDDEPTSSPFNRSDTRATRLVVKNTSADATIDLDATWRVGTGTGADDNGTTTGTGTATSTSSPLRAPPARDALVG